MKISLSVILFVSLTQNAKKKEKKELKTQRKGYFVEETNDYSTIYFEGEQVSMRH